MKKIAILGAGAHAAELEEYIYDNNQVVPNNEKIEIIGYYDDNVESNWERYELRAPLLGGIKKFQPKDNIFLLLGLAKIGFRKELVDYYLDKGAMFTNFIHHSSFVFRTSKIGVGNVICRNCVIGPKTEIGNFNTFNSNISIGHDSIIGENNVLCPNVGFSGSTSVGNNNFFSLNSTTIPKIKIGNNNIIAPNMTIEKDINDNLTIFHRFKEKVYFQK